MAGRTGQQASNKPANDSADVSKPPAGFEALSFDIDAWFKCQAGNVIFGRIESAFWVENKRGRNQQLVYVIRLGAPCLAVTKDEPEPHEYPKGATIALRETHNLRPLREYVGKRGIVWCKPEKQKDIGGGQTLWTFDLRAKGEKSAFTIDQADALPNASERNAPNEAGIDDEDVPF